jgi:hypothetical protein
MMIGIYDCHIYMVQAKQETLLLQIARDQDDELDDEFSQGPIL